ncbi:uncharacterized protein TNIN_393991 [Trichonephila inaurata madagascariensis]|uniref:CLIP domain-containing serine protease n=1 Tax=Trichonephila inaurata madagascariensis TaxID=2747483 RepID=A0A8X6Y713_9ARAC|nr:uncharacterized protein TNIN_393991 [Trichonephila inaurata madagascariensis]
MLPFVLRCIIAACLVCFCSAILLGRIRQKETPETNVVQTSRFLFPRTEEGPACKTDLGLLGHCVDVRLCYAARQAVSVGNHPIRCGWINNFIPMVCCHPEQVQHPKLVFRPYRHQRSDFY